MTTRVKLCGQTSAADVAAAVDAGADAIGVIAGVPVDTHREVDLETAATLFANTPPFVTKVLVTMPETPAQAIDRIEQVDPDLIQLHGSYEPDALVDIRASTPIIHAFDVGDEEAITAAEPFVDAILLDSTDEHGAGGTGETHDWTLARTRVKSASVPVILAGGLTPANVATAIERVRPYGVDVASGVETDQNKDPAAMASFVATARGGV